MAWDDRIIGKEISFWEGRLPKHNVFTITRIHPGSIAQAHQPYEFIAREQLAECERFLLRIADWAAA